MTATLRFGLRASDSISSFVNSDEVASSPPSPILRRLASFSSSFRCRLSKLPRLV
jgi:hypothetical protein